MIWHPHLRRTQAAVLQIPANLVKPGPPTTVIESLPAGWITVVQPTTGGLLRGAYLTVEVYQGRNTDATTSSIGHAANALASLQSSERALLWSGYLSNSTPPSIPNFRVEAGQSLVLTGNIEDTFSSAVDVTVFIEVQEQKPAGGTYLHQEPRDRDRTLLAVQDTIAENNLTNIQADAAALLSAAVQVLRPSQGTSRTYWDFRANSGEATVTDNIPGVPPVYLCGYAFSGYNTSLTTAAEVVFSGPDGITGPRFVLPALTNAGSIPGPVVMAAGFPEPLQIGNGDNANGPCRVTVTGTPTYRLVAWGYYG